MKIENQIVFTDLITKTQRHDIGRVFIPKRDAAGGALGKHLLYFLKICYFSFFSSQNTTPFLRKRVSGIFSLRHILPGKRTAQNDQNHGGQDCRQNCRSGEVEPDARKPERLKRKD